MSNFVQYDIKANPRPAEAAHKRIADNWDDTQAHMTSTGQQAAKQTAASLKKTGKEGEGAGKVTASGFKLATGGLLLAGAAALKLVGSLKSVASEAVAIAAAFETGMAEVSTLLGKDETARLGEYAEGLRATAEATGESLSAISKALYQTVSAGIGGTKNQLDFVRVASKAAIAGVSETSTAVEVLATVTNAWGVAAGSASSISDILFTVVKRGVTTFEQLSSAMGNVAGVASAAGVSYKQTMAALIPLTRVTKDTSLATTYLKNLITALAAPSDKIRGVFKALGIDVGATALAERGLVGIMRQVKDATGGNLEVLKQLFPNLRALQAAATLTGEGFDNMAKSLEEVNKAGGATAAAFKKMNVTFAAQKKRLTAIKEGLLATFGAELGKLLSGPMRDLTKWFKENRAEVQEWAKAAGYSMKIFVKPVLNTVKYAAKGLIWLRRTVQGTHKKMVSDEERMRNLRETLARKWDEAAKKRKERYLKGRRQRLADARAKEAKDRIAAYKKNLEAEKAASKARKAARKDAERKRAAYDKAVRKRALASAASYERSLTEQLNSETLRRLKQQEAAEKKALDAKKAGQAAIAALDAMRSGGQATADAYIVAKVGTPDQWREKFGKIAQALDQPIEEIAQKIRRTADPDLFTKMAADVGSGLGLTVNQVKEFSNQINTMVTGAATSAGQALSDMFKDMVTGQKLSTEELLAGMLQFVSKTLLQLAIMTTGWAIQWLGAQNYAAAAMAAAGAATLYALAGVASGGAALLSASATKKKEKKGVEKTSPTQTSLPGSSRGQASAGNTYIFNTSKEPWDSSRDVDRHRDFQRWIKRNDRARGMPLLPATSGAYR